MKNTVFILFSLLLLGGCKIDNYEAPGLTIKGKIVDSQTNALVESGGSNAGSIVKFYQNNSLQALIYKTFPDGSFTNSKVFAGEYRYVAEGPFKMAANDTPRVSIKANSDIEIKVIPNVRLNASVVSKTDTSAIIKITYEKMNPDQTLRLLGVAFSNVVNPNAFTFIGGGYVEKDVKALNLTSGTQEITIKGLKAKTKYYVRASAQTIAPGNYYNYSTQIEIQN